MAASYHGGAGWTIYSSTNHELRLARYFSTEDQMRDDVAQAEAGAAKSHLLYGEAHARVRG
jgi:hypothetical protein